MGENSFVQEINKIYYTQTQNAHTHTQCVSELLFHNWGRAGGNVIMNLISTCI